MVKELRWVKLDGKKQLFFSHEPGHWQHYTMHPLYQPDFNMPGIKVSRGFRTSQILLQNGYTYNQKQ